MPNDAVAEFLSNKADADYQAERDAERTDRYGYLARRIRHLEAVIVAKDAMIAALQKGAADA